MRGESTRWCRQLVLTSLAALGGWLAATHPHPAWFHARSPAYGQPASLASAALPSRSPEPVDGPAHQPAVPPGPGAGPAPARYLLRHGLPPDGQNLATAAVRG